ncbi:hypothetical protein BC941DRAFT_366443 [Chlamydoabsidia padenii]|nr:hypothetical protein BC941DRAFT_366443 [Chlamydoabsidia padenii]
MTDTRNSTKKIIPRWIFRLVGFTSLATALVSIAIYLYKQNISKTKKSLPRSAEEDVSETNQASSSQSNKTSGWSFLGSSNKNSSKKRKRVTISLKNTILWNPSSDTSSPNYAFHEHGQSLLSQLCKQHLVTIIIHVSDEEEKQQMEQLLDSVEGLDRQRILFCSTEEGKIHLIRHLESQIHIEGGWECDDGEDIVRKLRPFVQKVIWVITKRRRSSFNQSNLKVDDQGILGANVELTDHLVDTSLARDLGFTAND